MKDLFAIKFILLNENPLLKWCFNGSFSSLQGVDSGGQLLEGQNIPLQL